MAKRKNIMERAKNQVERNKNQSDIQSIKSFIANPTQNTIEKLYNTINQASLSVISEAFIFEEFVKNYKSFEDQTKLFSLIETRFATDIEHPEFKSEALVYSAEGAFNQNAKQSSEDIKFDNDLKIVQKLHEALKIKLNFMNPSAYRANQIAKIETLLEDASLRHSDSRNFELAKKSIAEKSLILTNDEELDLFKISLLPEETLTKDLAKTESLLRSLKTSAHAAKEVIGDDIMAIEALNHAKASTNIQLTILFL